MRVDPGPLTWGAAIHSWSPEWVSAVVIAALAVGYGVGYRRAGELVRGARAGCFAAGLAVWFLATSSVIGAYADVLFWVRALQVLLLLYVAPFFVAQGTPVTVLRAALGSTGRARVDRVLAALPVRVLAHPATTSLAMLATPWLLYLTPWYTASLENQAVGSATRILLVALGFGYFYARLQEDPVPRRYPQSLSLLITVAEALGDGVLGLVIWQGSLIGAAYYAGLHRSWGPDQRLDQTIGAGVLWIVGDLVGWPFVLVLMRAMAREGRAQAVAEDAELDRRDAGDDASPAPSGLWWENDPQLRERFGR